MPARPRAAMATTLKSQTGIGRFPGTASSEACQRGDVHGWLAAVLPVLGMCPDHGLHGLLERRRAAGAVAGIPALGDGPRVGERLLAGAGERNDGIGTEADMGRFAVEAYPLRLGLGEAADGGGLHKKAQALSAASIAVAAGNVDGVDEGGGESLGAFHQFWCYHFHCHNYRECARGRRETSRNGKRIFIRLLSGPREV